MTFRLITTVWGHEFADLFLRVTVRSLLSKGNLGALTGRHAAVYSIYTTEDTAHYLQRSPLFQQLQQTITTEFALFRSGDIDRNNSSSHWTGWRKGVNVARQNGEAAFFIIADMLYPENTLSRWADLFEQGYRAIWTSTVQVVQETALKEIETRFPRSSTLPISMSNQEVTDLAIRHLHPKFVCMFRDSGRASRHPEVVFTKVPGEGLAERAIGSHAMCVDPGFFDLSDALSPLNRFEAIAFESPTGVGFEPMLKQADLYARWQPLTEDRLSNMGSWLDYFFTPPDVIESRRTYRFAFQPIAREAEFRRVRDSLGFFACQVRLTGAIYRVARELRRVGCTLAAQLVATSHYAGRLRRHWRTKGAVTVFVPENAAIERWGLRHFSTLVMPGNERLLTDVVFAHLCQGTRDYSVGDSLVMPSDSRIASVAKVVAGPFQRDECTIYVIDRVLFSSASISSVSSNDEPRSSLLPNRWDVHATRLFSSAEPTSSSKVRPSPAVAAITPTPVVPSVAQRGRSLVKAGYYFARRIPGAARPADWLKSTVFATLHRIRSRRARTIGGSIAAVSGAGPAARSTGVSHASTGTAPSNELAELFRDVQRARAVLTLADVLSLYRTKISEFTTDLPALAMVEDCVREAGLTEQTLVTALRNILDQAPDFAEAWHELGNLLLAGGQYAEAVDCFDRCLTSKEIFRTHARTGCYVLAAASKAAALEATGFLDAAAETYRRAMDAGGQPGTVHVAYARLLRHLGNCREAATHFDIGLESDSTVCDFPSMPRDFAELSARLAQRPTQINDKNAEASAS